MIRNFFKKTNSRGGWNMAVLGGKTLKRKAKSANLLTMSSKSKRKQSIHHKVED